MNIMKQVLAGVFLIALFSGSVLAVELTGREIALKMDAVDTSLDAKRTSIMGHQP